MWLGGYDSTYVSGQMQFTPIVQQEYYNVGLVSFTVSGQVLNINIPSTIIVDSGTTNLVTSQENFDTIVTALQNSGAITFTSQAESTLFWSSTQCTDPIASSKVTINTQTVFYVTFPGQNGQPITVDIQTLGWIRQYYYTSKLSYYCLGIQVTQQDILIIGETVSYGHVVYYDRANNRVGFAEGIQCSVSPTVQGIDVLANGSFTASPSVVSFANQIFPTTSLLIIIRLLHLLMQME